MIVSNLVQKLKETAEIFMLIWNVEFKKAVRELAYFRGCSFGKAKKEAIWVLKKFDEYDSKL